MMEHRVKFVSELKGSVGTMQVLEHQGILYMGTIAPGRGTLTVDVRDPAHPRVIGEIPGYYGSYSPKVQIGDDLLLVNYEQRNVPASFVGFGIWDISDPINPKPVAAYSTGGLGVHRMWYAGSRYAYVSAVPEGASRRRLIVVDLKHPAQPREVSQWQPDGVSEPNGLVYAMHHPIVADNIIYAGWWDYGVVILDAANPAKPERVGYAGGWAESGGGHTHTALPLLNRSLLVVTDEASDGSGQEKKKFIRVFDISDKTQPRFLATCPVPEGDWGRGGTRFGPHNVHENRPGSWNSERYIFSTYFGGGLRVYDLDDPTHPEEVGYFAPDVRSGATVPINDLFVRNDGLVYLTDRREGNLYTVQWLG